MTERVPVRIPGQWSEARGFVRLYHNNPHYQAHLVKALYGFREELLQEYAGDEERAEVRAIDQALREFAEHHPEFLSSQPEDSELKLGPYEPDPLLTAYFNEHDGREIKE